MYVPQCRTRAVPPESARALLGVSLFYAAAILVAAWLHADGSLPGVDAAVIAAANLAGGWVLGGKARVRGLPLAAGAVMSAVVLAGAAIGAAPAVSAGAMFVALLLSVAASSWASGIAAIGILAAAVLLGWVL